MHSRRTNGAVGPAGALAQQQFQNDRLEGILEDEGFNMRILPKPVAVQHLMLKLYSKLKKLYNFLYNLKLTNIEIWKRDPTGIELEPEY